MRRSWGPVGLVLVMVLSAAAVASAGVGVPPVWGLKSKDPLSEPPCTLYSFSPVGGPFVSHGQVTLATVPIDVDGLAVAGDGTLYGFQVEGGQSRLVTLDPSTAYATVVGPYLSDTDLRGAAFTDTGRLVVLDAAADAVRAVDPATGQFVGPTMPVTLDGDPMPIHNFTDITQGPDGRYLIVGHPGNALYWVDLPSGEAVHAHTETVALLDGIPPTFAGLAFGPEPTHSAMLYAYDVDWDDDILAYDTADAFSRTQPYADILNSYNAGRGDLAAVAGAAPIPGDANRDGLVDTADYFALAGAWYDVGAWDDGDFTGDWLVDTADYFVLSANWYNHGTGTPLPEPATAALFLAGGLAALRRRR